MDIGKNVKVVKDPDADRTTLEPEYVNEGDFLISRITDEACEVAIGPLPGGLVPPSFFKNRPVRPGYRHGWCF